MITLQLLRIGSQIDLSAPHITPQGSCLRRFFFCHLIKQPMGIRHLHIIERYLLKQHQHADYL